MKYKGKTNADFTRLLLHCARAVSGFAQSDAPLTVLDPMCGKGTTLFCALEEGDHAVGMDVDAKALLEADQLLGRSLKMNRLKHKREESSLTVPKGKPVRSVGYRLSTSLEGWKNGDERTFRLLNGDLGVLPAVMARESCHLAVADLPYGVQHAPSEGRKVMSLANFASKVCESCFAVLKHGARSRFLLTRTHLPAIPCCKPWRAPVSFRRTKRPTTVSPIGWNRLWIVMLCWPLSRKDRQF